MDYGELTFVIFMLVCMGLYVLFIFGSIAIWAWMLVDAIKRENYKKEEEKITWIIVLALTGVIGAGIYYFVVKRKYDNATIIETEPSKVD